MDEDYQQFLDFDWTDERWQAYLNNLYPSPNQRQIVRFKKKWYKKHIDPNFDDAWEPPGATPATSPPTPQPDPSPSRTSPSGSAASGPSPAAFPSKAHLDGTRWAVMGKKATICFTAYAVALTMAVGSLALAFPPYQALLLLVSSFALDIVAKYGLKFKTEYLHAVLLDDVGVMPIMALTLLTPGLNQLVRTVALVPAFLTALLSFSQICKNHARLPPWLREFFSPLALPKARFQVMKVRAHTEVGLGFLLIAGVFLALAAPLSAILFWNFMMMRYMMSSWTQAAFRDMDNVLMPVLGKIPGVNLLYAALKRSLYSFVDPESRRAGRLCSIL